ncbi:MAG: hypothetical protein WB992_08125, partial [Bryobacteraceae bacterium]
LVDALGFLSTAIGTLVVNAVLAVALGCSFYLMRFVYRQLAGVQAPETRNKGRDAPKKIAVGSAR